MARKFILDTDWFGDCDDCVALRFLVRNMDETHQLLGVNINAATEKAYASLRAFLDNEKVSYPIGIDEPYYWISKTYYQENMAGDSPYTNADGEKSIDFYKRLLEENDDVEILSIGFLSSIANVLQAYPHLIKKIKKLWIMGGYWEVQGGLECNFSYHEHPVATKATQFIVNELQVEKSYLGFEVGVGVYTGSQLSETDMLGRALKDHGCTKGRDSWDPMLVMAALDDKYPGAFGYQYGKAFADETGRNYFENDENGVDRYALKIHDNAYYVQAIDEVIG
ncbi:MAG: nucleoside hydrolase [Clostridia bacterium]|nr:nucleoside hydrolase [Clostridia bacterium]